MPTALILSGAGRYADPWHPFPETSARLAALAQESGWRTVITEDIDQQLASGLDEYDLLIVNAGDPWMVTPPAPQTTSADPPTGLQCVLLPHDEAKPRTESLQWAGAGLVPDQEMISRGRVNLSAALARGIAVLGVHTAAASLRDYPEFRQVLGGEWVRERSWHPDFGELTIHPQPHPFTTHCPEFTTQDERYTDLDIDEHVKPLATTNDDDRTHLLTWTTPHPTSRIIYHGLGHDQRTYDSLGHQRFLRQLMAHLLPSTQPPWWS